MLKGFTFKVLISRLTIHVLLSVIILTGTLIDSFKGKNYY